MVTFLFIMKANSQFNLIHQGTEKMVHGHYLSALEFYTKALEKAMTKEEKVEILCYRWLAYFYLRLPLFMTIDIRAIRDIDPNSELIKAAWCFSYKTQDPPQNNENDELTEQQEHQVILEINSKAAAIFENIQLPKNYLDRGALFSAIDCEQLALCDFDKAVKLDPNSASAWYDIGASCFYLNKAELLDETVKRLESFGYNAALFEGQSNIIKHLFVEAFAAFKKLQLTDELQARSLVSHLYFLYGDISIAKMILAEDDSRGQLGFFDSLLLQTLHLFSDPEIPKTFDCTTPYSNYLCYLVDGIYVSLELPITKVPLDLFVSSSVQQSWIKWDAQIDKCASMAASYPDTFDKEIKNRNNLFKLFQKALNISNILARNTISYREQICIGLSLIQLVQTILEDPLSVDLDSSVAAIAHWIRIYDPLAALFYRTDTPFALYLQRNGVKAELGSYHGRVFKSLKSGLAATADPTIQKDIKSCNTPEELYGFIMSDACLRVGPKASIFLRNQLLKGVDMGIALPPLGHSFRNEYAKLCAKWAKLMNLINHGRSREPDTDTNDDFDNDDSILTKLREQMMAKIAEKLREINQQSESVDDAIEEVTKQVIEAPEAFFRNDDESKPKSKKNIVLPNLEFDEIGSSTITQMDIADFTNSAMEFLYEWMQLAPIAQCSHTIGHILFTALLMVYFGVEISKPMPIPISLQIEALLSVDMEMFVTIIKQCYPIHFKKSTEIRDLPNVIEELPTYHHRYQALMLIETTEFKDFYLSGIQSMIANAGNTNSEEKTQADTSIEST